MEYSNKAFLATRLLNYFEYQADKFLSVGLHSYRALYTCYLFLKIPKKIFSTLVNLIIFFEKLKKINIIIKIKKKIFFEKLRDTKLLANKINVNVKNKLIANL